jgi:transcriptional regulator with XRE-family HTH domain
MTPFGAKLRAMRAERGVLLKDMALDIGVSPTYLSALEHGKRGRPNWVFVQRVIAYFNVIWDDAEELMRLADVSHPKTVVKTAGLSPDATALANRLAQHIHELDGKTIAALNHILDEAIRSDRL